MSHRQREALGWVVILGPVLLVCVALVIVALVAFGPAVLPAVAAGAVASFLTIGAMR